MTLIGWLQIAVVLAIVVATAWPLGAYMARVFGGERTPLTRVVRPLEISFFRAAGINAAQEQTWLAYTLSMLTFQAVGFLALYGLLRTQGSLPLNPQGFPNVATWPCPDCSNACSVGRDTPAAAAKVRVPMPSHRRLLVRRPPFVPIIAQNGRRRTPITVEGGHSHGDCGHLKMAA